MTGHELISQLRKYDLDLEAVDENNMIVTSKAIGYAYGIDEK